MAKNTNGALVWSVIIASRCRHHHRYSPVITKLWKKKYHFGQSNAIVDVISVFVCCCDENGIPRKRNTPKGQHFFELSSKLPIDMENNVYLCERIARDEFNWVFGWISHLKYKFRLHQQIQYTNAIWMEYYIRYRATHFDFGYGFSPGTRDPTDSECVSVSVYLSVRLALSCFQLERCLGDYEIYKHFYLRLWYYLICLIWCFGPKRITILTGFWIRCANGWMNLKNSKLKEINEWPNCSVAVAAGGLAVALS